MGILITLRECMLFVNVRFFWFLQCISICDCSVCVSAYQHARTTGLHMRNVHIQRRVLPSVRCYLCSQWYVKRFNYARWHECM